jgi:hypothetical protein
MVPITRGKILKRETGAKDRGRPITIQLFPFYLGLGVKGTREFHTLPWENLLDRARLAEAQRKLRRRA